MNWQEFTDLQIAYRQEFARMNYEKALELNRQVYEVMFQIYSEIPQEKYEHKQYLEFRLDVLETEAITLEELLSEEAKEIQEGKKETFRQTMRKIGYLEPRILKLIIDEINKDGIYHAYLQSLIDNDYTKTLKLNRELCQRVSKIYSESEEPIKKQAMLSLKLFKKTAENIQIKLNNQEKRK